MFPDLDGLMPVKGVRDGAVFSIPPPDFSIAQHSSRANVGGRDG
jgi:hypothetical protein